MVLLLQDTQPALMLLTSPTQKLNGPRFKSEGFKNMSQDNSFLS